MSVRSNKTIVCDSLECVYLEKNERMGERNKSNAFDDESIDTILLFAFIIGVVVVALSIQCAYIVCV